MSNQENRRPTVGDLVQVSPDSGSALGVVWCDDKSETPFLISGIGWRGESEVCLVARASEALPLVKALFRRGNLVLIDDDSNFDGICRRLAPEKVKGYCNNVLRIRRVAPPFFMVEGEEVPFPFGVVKTIFPDPELLTRDALERVHGLANALRRYRLHTAITDPDKGKPSDPAPKMPLINNSILLTNINLD